jgi:hypothetical protein
MKIGKMIRIPLKDLVIIGKDWFFERKMNGEV